MMYIGNKNTNDNNEEQSNENLSKGSRGEPPSVPLSSNKS